MEEFVTGTDLASALDIVQNGLNIEKARELGGDGSFWAMPVAQIESARFFALVNPALSPQCALVKMTVPSKTLEDLLKNSLLEIILDGPFYRFAPDSFGILNEKAVFELIASFLVTE